MTIYLPDIYEINRAVERFDADQSFLNFFRLAWPYLGQDKPLVINYAIEAVCDHLEAVARGEILRLLMNVPPGTAKTLTTSIALPAYIWGALNMPYKHILSTAHSFTLAEESAGKTRDFLNTDFFQRNYGHQFQLSPSQNTKAHYVNTAGGRRVATAAQSVTGRRGDYVIYDDPHTVAGGESETIRNSVVNQFRRGINSRVRDPLESAIIVMMQRVHQGDVSGFILENLTDWTHLMLPMEFERKRRCFSPIKPSYMKAKKEKTYWNPELFCWQREPPTEKQLSGEEIREALLYPVDPRKEEGELLDTSRYDQEFIETQKLTMGDYGYAGQFQQRPVPIDGGLFNSDKLKFIDDIGDLDSPVQFIARGWDLAASTRSNSPYTAGMLMALLKNGAIVAVDMARFRGEPFEVRTKIKRCANRDGFKTPIDFPQDPGQAGKDQVESYRRELHGHIVTSSPESGDKVARAEPFASQVNGGNVYIVRGTWNHEFINEISTFPHSIYKDQVDACSRVYNYIVRKTKRRKSGTPYGSKFYMSGMVVEPDKPY